MWFTFLGTGKTLLIKYLTNCLNKEFGKGFYKLLAPTGVCALNIKGQTIHSVLHMPRSPKRFKPLKGEALRKLCNDFENVSFLIVDEYSMIGLNLLSMIDKRCRQATGKDEPMGGLFCYFLGDFRQLPPVKDTAWYADPINYEYKQHGKCIASQFEVAFHLEKCFRQADQEFLSILDRMSFGKRTKEDYDVLAKRFKPNVGNEEISSFDSAIHLFATKDEVKAHNYEQLRMLKDPDSNNLCPVAKIVARHNIKTAANDKTNESDGLEPVIHLAKGCKIMLRANLWVAKGLTNGTIGNVVDIIYSNSSEPPLGFPDVILCKFENYNGPGIGVNKDIVPIPAITKSWMSQCNQRCTRTQFPLSLCYGMSIHKAQGLTLEKVSKYSFEKKINWVIIRNYNGNTY